VSEDLKDLISNTAGGDRIRLQFADGSETDCSTLGRLPGECNFTVDAPFEDSLGEEPRDVKKWTLQKKSTPMFEFHRGTGLYWFGPYANDLTGAREELRRRYVTFGKLLALALVNRCKIAFALPLLFFRTLLAENYEPTLDEVGKFDSTLHSTLSKCLTMKAADFTALKLGGGYPDAMTPKEYVAEQIKDLLTPKAIGEVRSGFWSMIPERGHLQGVTASDLHQIICPLELNRDLDFRKVFKVVMDDEMSKCQPFEKGFWSVIDNLSPDEKKQFLVFVTCVENPPEPGTERLMIELPYSAFDVEEHKALLNMLPQAHTCSNTLELPNYYESLKESGTSEKILEKELVKLLGQKIRIAIKEAGGYELDATGSAHDVRGGDSSASSAAPWHSPATNTSSLSGYPGVPVPSTTSTAALSQAPDAEFALPGTMPISPAKAVEQDSAKRQHGVDELLEDLLGAAGESSMIAEAGSFPKADDLDQVQSLH